MGDQLAPPLLSSGIQVTPTPMHQRGVSLQLPHEEDFPLESPVSSQHLQEGTPPVIPATSLKLLDSSNHPTKLQPTSHHNSTLRQTLKRLRSGLSSVSPPAAPPSTDP